MNTQTHLLLALATLARRGHARDGAAQGRASSPASVEAALLLGALLPDASLFVMWGQAKLAGVPEERIWRELYYSDLWQGIGAMSNSLPLFALGALLAWAAGGRLVGAAARSRPLLSALLAVSAAALLHVLTDLPLHNDDGHPHFWPFSDWIFVSPVSYWDPDHHGRTWSLIELALAALLIAVLWRRYRSWRARLPLALAALSYAGVALYWSIGLGGG